MDDKEKQEVMIIINSLQKSVNTIINNSKKMQVNFPLEVIYYEVEATVDFIKDVLYPKKGVIGGQ